MNKFVTFEGIGYVAATFPVSTAAQTYLTANHLNAKTGNVDVNGKNLAVTLGEDGTVGFGTGSEPLLGIMKVYEMDGFATIQIKGGIDEVPTSGELTTGTKKLVVTAAGAIAAGDAGRQADVVLPATADGKLASIIL